MMTRKVISVASDASAMQAGTLMLKHQISGLPVVDSSGVLLGIISEGDFLRRAELGTQRRRPRWLAFLIGPGRLASEYVHACGRKVKEIMTPNPYTVTEATPVTEVVQLMERHRIKRVPVVCGRRLVGIVSRADLLRALARLARATETVATNDAEVRERVMAELRRQSWAPLDLINVIVRDRIVELQGTITEDSARQAMVVAAENVPGVRAVHDHLVWVEPVSGMTVLPQDTCAASVNAS
ncbi:MAG: CBS domain-containing protein [Pseudolabrys sp.]